MVRKRYNQAFLSAKVLSNMHDTNSNIRLPFRSSFLIVSKVNEDSTLGLWESIWWVRNAFWCLNQIVVSIYIRYCKSCIWDEFYNMNFKSWFSGWSSDTESDESFGRCMRIGFTGVVPTFWSVSTCVFGERQNNKSIQGLFLSY